MNFGPWELLIILAIVIAIFGAGRIAGIGGAIGGSIREFKKAVRDDSAAAGTAAEQNDNQVETKV